MVEQGKIVIIHSVYALSCFSWVFAANLRQEFEAPPCARDLTYSTQAQQAASLRSTALSFSALNGGLAARRSIHLSPALARH